MSNTLVGLSGPIWGTIGDTEIIVDNISEGLGGDREPLPDGQGDIVAASYHGSVGELSMDFIIKDGSAASYLLTRGAEITLPTGENDINSDSQTLYLDTWEKTKSRGDWYQGSLTAHYYPEMS